MSLERHFRYGSQRTIWIGTTFASLALFATLAARNALPHFPQRPRVQSSINAESHRDPRPRFDDNDSNWVAPAESLPQLLPPIAESAHLTPSPRRFAAIQTKGFHFNRPPPIN